MPGLAKASQPGTKPLGRESEAGCQVRQPLSGLANLTHIYSTKMFNTHTDQYKTKVCGPVHCLWGYTVCNQQI